VVLILEERCWFHTKREGGREGREGRGGGGRGKKKNKYLLGIFL